MKIKFLKDVKLLLYLSMTAALMLVLAAVTSATSACPDEQTVLRSNGFELTMRCCGDEYFNWVQTSDDCIIAYNEKINDWCYAEIVNGMLTPTSEAVGSLAKTASAMSGQAMRLHSTDDEFITLRNTAAEMAKAQDETELYEPTPLTANARIDQSTYKSEAIQKDKYSQDLLIILIEYNNVSLIKSMDYWSETVFSSTGKTVVSYYSEVSGGKFSFTKPDYVAEDGLQTPLNASINEVEIKNGIVRVKFKKDHPGQSMIKTDVRNAFIEISRFIDYSDYIQISKFVRRDDLNISAIVAGYEGSCTAFINDSRKTWGQSLSGTQYNGIYMSVSLQNATPKLVAFTVQGEVHSGALPNGDNQGTAKIMGIGVLVHELGHSLGLTDLYDSGDDSAGLGAYSLMGEGNWGACEGEYSSQTPVGLDPWSKIQLGFSSYDTVEIDMNDTETENSAEIKQSGTDGCNILKITSPLNNKQYFLIENRGMNGFDAGMYSFGFGVADNNGGILIYHIDEDVIESGGLINSNSYHQAVGLVPADDYNIRSLASLDYRKTSSFYKSDGVSHLNAVTVPNSNFYFGGHSEINGGAGSSYKTDYECHLKNIITAIDVTVNSPVGVIMNVTVKAGTHIVNGVCEDGLDWEYNAMSSTLTVSGKAAMTDYHHINKKTPWSIYSPVATHIKVGQGVMYIGNYAFSHMDCLQTVEIPESVMLIGEYAFANTPALEYITVDYGNVNYFNDEKGVLYGRLYGKETVEMLAYPSASKDSLFVIPDYVSVLREYLFAEAENLCDVVVPASVDTVYDGVFFGCDTLISVFFYGDAPSVFGENIFGNTGDIKENFVLFYIAGKNGWTTPHFTAGNDTVYARPFDGDINDDGAINITDVALLNSYITSKNDYAPKYDINSDYFINVEDIRLLVSYIMRT